MNLNGMVKISIVRSPFWVWRKAITVPQNHTMTANRRHGGGSTWNLNLRIDVYSQLHAQATFTPGRETEVSTGMEGW